MARRFLTLALAGGLALAPLAAAAQERHAVIVTFGASPDRTTVEALREAGVEMGQLAAGTTYFASVPAGALDTVREDVAEMPVELQPVPVAAKTRTLGDGRSPLRLDQGDPHETVAVMVLPAVGNPDASVGNALEAIGREIGLEVLDANADKGWIVRLARGRIEALAEAPFIQALYPAPAFPSLD